MELEVGVWTVRRRYSSGSEYDKVDLTDGRIRYGCEESTHVRKEDSNQGYSE